MFTDYMIWPFQRFRLVFCFVSTVLFLLLATPPQSSANMQSPSECEPHFPAIACANLSVSDGDNVSAFGMDSVREDNLIGSSTFMNSSSVLASAVPAPFTETAADGTAPVTVVAENRITDWSGVWRDTGILVGSQFVAAGLIYIMPESVSNWSDEQKKNSFK